MASNYPRLNRAAMIAGDHITLQHSGSPLDCPHCAPCAAYDASGLIAVGATPEEARDNAIRETGSVAAGSLYCTIRRTGGGGRPVPAEVREQVEEMIPDHLRTGYQEPDTAVPSTSGGWRVNKIMSAAALEECNRRGVAQLLAGLR